MFKNCKALAARLNRNVMAFDIEHTGGTKESRGITEFASHTITPNGEVLTYASLVKPPRHVEFNSYVTEITGITKDTVRNAPNWLQVAEESVELHKDALWVGFNSRSSDMPIIIGECEYVGVDFTGPEHHLDLLRTSPIKGSLSVQIKHFCPNINTVGAHRAAKDALMTMHLLEVLLGKHHFEDLYSGRAKLKSLKPIK